LIVLPSSGKIKGIKLKKENYMVKSIAAKVLMVVSIILMIIFLGGLIYLRYDYYTHVSPYASTPLSVYYIIHGLFTLVPSILCFIIFLIIKPKSSSK